MEEPTEPTLGNENPAGDNGQGTGIPEIKPEKRSRRKSKIGDIGAIPGTDTVRTGDSDPGKPRTTNRKPKPRTEKVQVSINFEHLVALHQFVAMTIQAPELIISVDEAQKLEDAINKVMAEYKIILDAKHAAWANLLLVALTIYGLRAIAIIQRKKMERAQAHQNMVQKESREPIVQGSDQESEEVKRAIFLAQSMQGSDMGGSNV